MNKLNLPPEFISNIQNTFREDGYTFLKALPDLIAEASARWGLTNIEPVSNLSYNFVAFATSSSPLTPLSKGEGNVVLKIGVPRDELTSEIAALKLFNGDGACQLLDADEEKGFLLLESLNPGVMLATLEDDEEATHIAAEVMQKIWRNMDSGSLLPNSQEQDNSREQAPGLQNFIHLSNWFDGLKKLRPFFNGGTGPFNEKTVERVERSVKDFFVENHMPVLMHGDFHHFNILSSERGWLVIDPKGVIGPAGYEVGPLMINPWSSHFDRLSAAFSDGINIRLRVKRRIDILHEHLGFERERILEWSLAHAVLSAWWSIEDNTDGDFALQFAELLAELN